MKPYLALIANDLRLALRDRSVIFFNYLFPLIFFFAFGGMFHAERAAGAAATVVTMVLVMGVLGNGLFGAGMRAVKDREAGILRRFKVAPISPLPMLMAALITGWLLYLPTSSRSSGSRTSSTACRCRRGRCRCSCCSRSASSPFAPSA